MKIKFLVSSDIHGFVFPYSYSNKTELAKGFLKIVSYFRKHKDENTIVIDNGDTIEGSPLLKYACKDLNGDNIMAYGINTIYDYVNAGNHDFNYGSEYLYNYLNSLNNKCICGNVFYKGKRIGQEYVIKQIGDKKIALIGATTQAVLGYETKDHLKDIELIDAYEYVKQTLSKIDDVDLKVVIYHGGLNTDADNNYIKASNENEGYQMCRDLDFDILISGHQHRSINYTCFNKLIVQCNSNGDEIIEINYDFDNKTSEANLLKPDCDIDDDLLSYYLPYEQACQKWLDTPLARVDNVDLKIVDEFEARLYKSPVVSFINQIQLDYTHAQLSACALFNGAKGFNANISLRDLLNTYVYPNNLVTIKICGKILKQYLEKNAEYFDIKDNKIVVADDYLKPVPLGFNYDMVDGIDYKIKVSNPRGSRIVDLKYDGKPIEDDDEFSLAINSFRAAGVSGFDMLKGLETLSISNKEIVEIISDYLSDRMNVVVKHNNNIVVEK